MLSRILAASALTFGLATGAMAQYASGTNTQPNDPGMNSSSGTQEPMGNGPGYAPPPATDPNFTYSTTTGINPNDPRIDCKTSNAESSAGSHDSQGRGCD